MCVFTDSFSFTEDPRYPDPYPGGPSAFQQRLNEIAGSEHETVRWERNKKLKRRLRQEASNKGNNSD